MAQHAWELHTRERLLEPLVVTSMLALGALCQRI